MGSWNLVSTAWQAWSSAQAPGGVPSQLAIHSDVQLPDDQHDHGSPRRGVHCEEDLLARGPRRGLVCRCPALPVTVLLVVLRILCRSGSANVPKVGCASFYRWAP